MREPLQFQEQWCNSDIKNAIGFYYNAVRNMTGEVTEIGCWEGMSSVYIANLIYPERLICIDPFTGTIYESYEAEQYSQRDIESTFRHNIANGTHGNVDIRKMGWEKYVHEYHYPRIKFLYLDGPHGYDDVCEQLENIHPLIMNGGLIVGDDYDAFPSVKNAVHDILGDEAIQTPFSVNTWVWQKGSNVSDL